MTKMASLLERFHQVLVDEIRHKRPEYLSGPFTVAEIYQNLVPYGTHRDQIGVEMNGDYEDALLRLLAGEGGFLVLESDAALRNLRRELESSNPNTGLYREFAAVDVRLAPAFVSAGPVVASQPVLDPDPTPMSMADLAPPEEPEVADLEEEIVVEDTPVASSDQPDAEAPVACRWCRADLPRRESLNFCPFCGTDVHVVPCPNCSEELEPGWRFCLACGIEVGD